MKNIKIPGTLTHWASLLVLLGFMSVTACNNTGERAETDYVNEIEAAENAVGDPILENANDDPGEPQEIAPADVQTEDTVSVIDDDIRNIE